MVMNNQRTIAEQSLDLTGMFEAEILCRLVLREWKHPLSENPEYRNHLLEAAADILQSSVSGEALIDDVSPQHMNLIAAMWLSECTALGDESIPSEERSARRQWLGEIQRALPSCFCNPEFLR